MARCQIHATAGVQRVARRYARSHAGSPYAVRVLRVCVRDE
ncbi:MAG: hypothetical protein AAGF11_18990 [Myxococcota bacterium]